MRSNGPLANKKVAMGGHGWPGGLVASWPKATREPPEASRRRQLPRQTAKNRRPTMGLRIIASAEIPREPGVGA